MERSGCLEIEIATKPRRFVFFSDRNKHVPDHLQCYTESSSISIAATSNSKTSLKAAGDLRSTGRLTGFWRLSTSGRSSFNPQPNEVRLIRLRRIRTTTGRRGQRLAVALSAMLVKGLMPLPTRISTSQAWLEAAESEDAQGQGAA